MVKALGLSHECEVDIYTVPLRPGELLLSCSDGLTAMVSDKDILEILNTSNGTLNDICRILVDEANRRGGKDNITVALAEVAN